MLNLKLYGIELLTTSLMTGIFHDRRSESLTLGEVNRIVTQLRNSSDLVWDAQGIGRILSLLGRSIKLKHRAILLCIDLFAFDRRFKCNKKNC